MEEEAWGKILVQTLKNINETPQELKSVDLKASVREKRRGGEGKHCIKSLTNFSELHCYLEKARLTP